MTTAIAVTIAGSDSSGGAGIQADLKTFAALGVYGASVITALTAQNTRGVAAVQAVPAALVTAQIDAVFSDLAVGAAKIGMLADAAIVKAVADGIARHRAPNIVLDTVMVATSGERLLAPDAVAVLRAELIPRALVVTPNLAEAAALLDEPEARDEEGIIRQAHHLRGLGAKAVLMKGGHAGGAESTDILVTGGEIIRLPAPRIAARNTHGTGCTLASAVAAGLATGEDITGAVRNAKAYVTGAIAAADRLAVGTGRGPLHHFFKWWDS